MKKPTKKQLAQIEPFARLTVRRDAGLILGKSHRYFKPGRVYEIRKVLDEDVIRDIGPSAMGEALKDSLIGVNWNHDVGHILDCGGGYHLWTRQEYQALLKKERESK